MLATLTIQNVVIIEKLTIEFKGGLCALTGETGAGKSILLDSLGLALGHRAEARLVRKGTDKASVTACFDIPDTHSIYEILEEAGIEFEPGEPLILKRIVNADGRSKAFINDQPVSASILKRAGECLIEIHGQFDTQGLLDPSTHAAILDEYAGVQGGLSPFWKEYKAAQRRLSDLQETQDKMRAEEEYLRSALEDLDEINPQKGEEEHLAALHERLRHREQVLESLNAAYHALSGDNDPVRQAMGVLGRVSDKLPEAGDEVFAALDRAAAEMQEALSLLNGLSADLQDEDQDLQSIDERLFALRGLARKHQCGIDDLPDIREKLAGDLNDIEHGDDALSGAIQRVESSKQAYIQKAEEISKARKIAATKMDGLIAQELAPLKLERAQFVTHFTPLDEAEWGGGGMESVQFLVSTNPGAEAGPLHKIASGGEMSRFMLALKVVMAEIGAAPTLIFDEVDAGIGGATADAVGQRLGRLAADKQILVVTHSPQVAARADHQWIVQKAGGADSVSTSVLPLPDPKARREEIARMLAGSSITEEARAAADKLLESRAA